MRLYKAILLWVSSIFVHLGLLLIFASLSVYFLIGNKQAAKEVLLESGVYTQFVDAVIADNNADSSKQKSSLPLDDPEIQKIARQSFSAKALQDNSEHFIDQLYAWLLGEKDELTFEVELNPEKEVFVELVSTYAANKVAALESCGQRDISMITIFELDCRPEGVSSSFIKERVREDLLSTDFFQDIRITEKDLPKTKNGQYLHEQYSFVPQIIQNMKSALWIFILVFVLSSALFVYARRPFRKGFKAYGRDLLSNALTLIVVTAFFGFMLPNLTESLSVEGNKTVTLFNNVSDTYIQRLDTLVINIALQTAAVGVLVLMLERVSRPWSKYDNVAKKSGLTTSYAKREVQGKLIRKPMPPVQTSETRRRVSTKKKSVPKKYRKIGVE